MPGSPRSGANQTPQRANALTVEWDGKFEIAKVNPLVTWTAKDVWRYLAKHDVPYNPLHDQGLPQHRLLAVHDLGRAGRGPAGGTLAGHGEDRVRPAYGARTGDRVGGSVTQGSNHRCSSFPAFLKLNGRRVVVVGGGPVAASKVRGLQEAGAEVTVIRAGHRREDRVDARRHADPPPVRAIRPRRRLARRRRGIARGEPRSGARRGRPPALRQRGRRSAERQPLSRRRGASRAAPRSRSPPTAGRPRSPVCCARDSMQSSPRRISSGGSSSRIGLRARWRRDDTPMEARRPELLDALIAIVRTRRAGGRPRPMAAASSR